MQIREVSRDDVSELMELYHQLLPWETLDYERTQMLLDEITEDKNYMIFVLVHDNVIVSTCTLVVIKNLTHGGRPFGIIENMVTKSEYRGKGYGERLLKEVINHARKIGCHKLMVQTRRKENYVINFYCKCGFSDGLSKGLMIDYEKWDI